MRRTALLSALAVVFAFPAFAADVPDTVFPSPGAPIDTPVIDQAFNAVAPVSTWTGYYAGASVGHARSENKFGFDADAALVGGLDLGSIDGTQKKEGTIGGLHFGYNYQLSNYVFGLEADINVSDIVGSRSASIADPLGDTISLDLRQKLDWYGTLRPRVGYAPVENLLVYGTGGLAYGRVKTSTAFEGGPTGDPAAYSFSGSDSDVRYGWTAGAGAEFALTQNVSLRGEYLYVDLGDESYRLTSGTDVVEVKSANEFHLLKAGVNFKF